MGGCNSTPEADLPPATEADLKLLKERGHLPIVGIPSMDFHGKNQMQTLYVAVYENGTELTLLFLDEDRPNACGDCFYDTIRRPLFGRYSDIESVIIIGNEVHFPGTYSADQAWKTMAPAHMEKVVDLATFEKREANEPILWINTWNHLIGDKNNNTTMEITYQHAQAVGGMESLENKDFLVRKGSRAEVDARFKGLMTSVATVMTPERSEKLGKRIF